MISDFSINFLTGKWVIVFVFLQMVEIVADVMVVDKRAVDKGSHAVKGGKIRFFHDFPLAVEVNRNAHMFIIVSRFDSGDGIVAVDETEGAVFQVRIITFLKTAGTGMRLAKRIDTSNLDVRMIEGGEIGQDSGQSASQRVTGKIDFTPLSL